MGGNIIGVTVLLGVVSVMLAARWAAYRISRKINDESDDYPGPCRACMAKTRGFLCDRDMNKV